MKCPKCGVGISMGFIGGIPEPCDDCLLEQDRAENPELYDEEGNYKKRGI